MTRDEAKRFVRIFKKACPKITMNRKQEMVLADLFVLAFTGGENSQIIMRKMPFTVTAAEMLEAMETAEDIAAAAASLAEYKCLGGKTLAEFKKELGL